MRTNFRRLLSFGLVISFAVPALTASAARIDAQRGRQYRMTKRHGPWMIMVASLGDIKGKDRTSGMTAQQAADELVFELRKKRIPAYTFSQKDVLATVDTVDRRGRQTQRSILAQEGRISVLAGNYHGADDEVGRKTLTYIKQFYPKFLENHSNGGRFRRTPGKRKPTPLSGAFLTVNPLLSPEEAQERKRDPLIMKLNSGMDHSLLDNKGKYSLVVKTFYGRSTTRTVNNKRILKVDRLLDRAGMSAWQLTKMLREGRLPTRNGILKQNFEAYVYHDRYQSVVTVGSFDSPNDPRIRQLAKLFGAKIAKNRTTGQDVLTAEALPVPGSGANGAPLKTWVFDPYPKLMKVPHRR